MNGYICLSSVHCGLHLDKFVINQTIFMGMIYTRLNGPVLPKIRKCKIEGSSVGVWGGGVQELGVRMK
jgi:hypothetical protein